MIEPLANYAGLNTCINITQQCNLRCEYCYENKTSGVINIDTAMKFIDVILTDEDPGSWSGTRLESINDLGLVLDLIGGDALMHPDLCDKILTYLQFKLHLLNHRCKDKWRVSISTNGTLFGNPKVREFLEKWHDNISLGVSLDGCPEIHDRYRVYPDGSPSLPKILEWWDWYKEWFPTESVTTKSTCSKESIKYLLGSLIFLHETLGIKYINQNFIMEDSGATEEDYIELDKQLSLCTEYVLAHKDEMYWSIIDRMYTTKYIKSIPLDLNEGHCGSGGMPACSITGDIYPCFRWLPISMNNRDTSKFICGNVNDGLINKSALKLVQESAKKCNCCKDTKCLDCDLVSVCPYCIAGCYAETGEFKRTTHNCEYIKLQHKWSDIYWSRYEADKNN